MSNHEQNIDDQSAIVNCPEVTRDALIPLQARTPNRCTQTPLRASSTVSQTLFWRSGQTNGDLFNHPFGCFRAHAFDDLPGIKAASSKHALLPYRLASRSQSHHRGRVHCAWLGFRADCKSREVQPPPQTPPGRSNDGGPPENEFPSLSTRETRTARTRLAGFEGTPSFPTQYATTTIHFETYPKLSCGASALQFDIDSGA
jgi:hypothetical protein